MMKQIFHSLALFTALLLPLELFGQSTTSQEGPSSPIPMFAEGVRWNVLERFFETEWEPGLIKVYEVGEPYQYGVEGKETIGGKNYYHVTTVTKPKRKPEVDFYAREEGTKVYVRLKNSNEEYLIFDYAIKPGEEFVGKGEEPSMDRFYDTFILDSINVQKIAGANRRVYHFTLQPPFRSSCTSLKDDDHSDTSSSTVNSRADFVWIEGIGTTENTPFYQNKGMTGSKPDLLLAYTDVSGVQHTPTGLPANWSWRKLMFTQTTGLGELAEASARIRLKEGILSVDLGDGKSHRLSVYSLDGVRLLPETSFTDSFSAQLGYSATLSPLVVVLDGKATLLGGREAR